MTPTLIASETTAEGGTRKPVSPDNPLPVKIQSVGSATAIALTTPGTAGSGGLSVYSNTALSATKAVVTAVPTSLFGFHILNTNAAITYIQFFNKLTANVTVGTTTPDFVIGIPANGAVTLPRDLALDMSIGVVIAATTTVGGAVAPTTAVVAALFYK